MQQLIHVFLHSLEETGKLLPFLFLAYLLLEFIEHKAAEKTVRFVSRTGRLGPLFGGILGVLPQCGFSASVSNLYAGRLVSLGTLISVFLSTSDEMLPVMLSEQVELSRILAILGIKVACGILIGFLIDLILRSFGHPHQAEKRGTLCQNESCRCEKGIVLSALTHTVQIALFVFVLSLLFGGLVEVIGEEALARFAAQAGVFSTLICGLIGLIPNCASSVLLTELFLDGIIGTGSLLAGLLAGSGVGLLVLFRVHKDLKANLLITGIVYLSGIMIGLLFDLIGIVL